MKMSGSMGSENCSCQVLKGGIKVIEIEIGNKSARIPEDIYNSLMSFPDRRNEEHLHLNVTPFLLMM
jgi:hypothetical protein